MPKTPKNTEVQCHVRISRIDTRIVYHRLFILDTTRPMRTGEVPGREYLFVSREKMEADITAGKFIEHGEFRGHLYGTSADSVKTIINAGAVCIMNPHYQAIKALRTPQLKPYVIHIKPPLFDDLKVTRRNGKAISSYDETSSRGFTVNIFSATSLTLINFEIIFFKDDELHEMLKSAERIEFLYGHLFDETIVNDDLDLAFDQLFETVTRSENESMWAPASWVQ